MGDKGKNNKLGIPTDDDPSECLFYVWRACP